MVFLLALLPLCLALPLRAQDPNAQLFLVTPEGHTDRVTSAAFSPDGRLIVTASQDGTARLWEASTGRELGIVGAHGQQVTSAAFSPDARVVVTSSGDGTARLWDAATGREIRNLAGHDRWVASAAFSPDGRFVLTASWDGTARVWDVSTGREIVRFDVRSPVNSAAFSPDGRFVVTASDDELARIWDAAAGSELRRLEGHTGAVASAAFSPDGRLIVTASSDATDPIVRVWDAATGRELRALEGPPGNVRTAAFSPDRRFVVTGGITRIWDVETGAELRRIDAHTAWSAVFSPDGRFVLTGSPDMTARLWDAASGREVRRFEGHTVAAQWAAVSPDGRLVLTALGDGTARLWDVASGRDVRRLEGHTGPLLSAAFSADGGLAITASRDRTARVWEVNTGRELMRLGQADYVSHASFSPDARLAVTAGNDGTARIWDVATGRELRVLRGHESSVASVVFSPDGRLVATASGDGTARLWDAASGRELRRLRTGWSQYAAFSPDGRMLVTTAGADGARIWEVATGRELRRLEGHRNRVVTAVFSADGRLVVTAARDGTARVWDAESGRELSVLNTYVALATAFFSPDARHVVIGSTDHTVRIFEATGGNELFRRFHVGAADWIIVTPDGRFDGTETGIQLLHYARGLETLGLESFFDRYYTPGVAGLLLAGARYDGPDVRRDFLPPPEVRIVSPRPGEASSGTVVVAVETTDRGGGLEDVRLYHNSALVGGTARSFATAGAPQCPSGATCFTVELLPGMVNTLEATAFSRDRTEAERARVVLEVPGAAPAATLHVFSVGINSYRNPRYNLNYGRADATAFADSLRAGSARIFAGVRVHTLFDLDATRENITAHFTRLAREARPEDVFVFFFAGHGTAERIGDSTHFFLVPAEVTQMSDPVQLARAGISGGELRALFEAIPARKKLMVLDACNSGEAVVGFARRGAAEERAIAQLARSTGLFVVSSADSDQFALEFAALGHGVLTYSVLSSLAGARGEPPRPRTVREIIARAEQLVPDLSQRHRGLPQYPMVWSHGMDFPLVVR